MSHPYLQPYRESLDLHGVGFEATLWASRESQRIRFKTMTEMCFLVGKRVMDVGCGSGDFAAYLIDHEVLYDRFIGIDALEEVIAHATERGLPSSEFHAGDVIADEKVLIKGEPDVVCISGTLNTMSDRQMMQMLEAAWRAAGQVLMFNFLSDRTGPNAPPQLPPARRMDTLKLLDWAMRRSTNVCFRQDYFESGHDATILMRKEE
ncbi:MAG: class I SAM-dependent methyltransferase [Phycisphaeraceae bacterium]